MRTGRRGLRRLTMRRSTGVMTHELLIIFVKLKPLGQPFRVDWLAIFTRHNVDNKG